MNEQIKIDKELALKGIEKLAAVLPSLKKVIESGEPVGVYLEEAVRALNAVVVFSLGNPELVKAGDAFLHAVDTAKSEDNKPSHQVKRIKPDLSPVAQLMKMLPKATEAADPKVPKEPTVPDEEDERDGLTVEELEKLIEKVSKLIEEKIVEHERIYRADLEKWAKDNDLEICQIAKVAAEAMKKLATVHKKWMQKYYPIFLANSMPKVNWCDYLTTTLERVKAGQTPGGEPPKK